jgi:CGNR zinc finger
VSAAAVILVGRPTAAAIRDIEARAGGVRSWQASGRRLRSRAAPSCLGQSRRDEPQHSDPKRRDRILRWRVTLEDDQLVLAAEGAGWQQVAGTLLSDVLLAQQHDLWPRLKPCRNPRCSVIFYDNSKNRSRVWHNTSTCGNLINLRAARTRRRERSR